MEYVDGRTVRDLLQEGHRLLPERSLEIIDGVLRALDYSHQAGIVHRDIKPGNVMVTRNGDIKVMDFGIARAMSDAQATMTQTAQVIGTAQYLSPEQATGQPVDGRSDILWRGDNGTLFNWLASGNGAFASNAATFSTIVAADQQAARPGDFNCDGKVNITDVIIAANADHPT